MNIVYIKDLQDERDAFRDGMLALLGGPGFRTEYECEHGTPLGRKCVKHCHLNPTRDAIKRLPR